MAGWLKRRSSSASSSSRHARMAHAFEPARASSSGVAGSAPAGADIVSVATRARGRSRDDRHVAVAVERLEGDRLRGPPPAALRPSPRGGASPPRSNSLRVGASSTSPHSSARLPRTPSAIVAERVRRDRGGPCRLSTSRVSPPVPGSTPRSGRFREADDARAVVGQHNRVAREGELVAAARGRARERREALDAALDAQLLEVEPRLVRELAEVDLEAVAARAEHVDVRARREHAVLSRSRGRWPSPPDARSGCAAARRPARCRPPRSYELSLSA